MPKNPEQKSGTQKSGTERSRRKPDAVPEPAIPLIVGIGASAGGLAAFKAFFSEMPAGTGMTFVLVQHLDPDHQSMLVELLAPYTRMPVAEAQDGLKMAVNHVYVIPPNATLTFEDGFLRVSKPAPARAYRRPIDSLFVSLAQNHDECAVGIVLSGVGSDGSLGLGTIKEHGGLTLAQAEFDSSPMRGMPHSAVATGLVDIVAPVETMPKRLIEYQRHLTGVADQKDSVGTRQDASQYLAAITSALRQRINHDFSGYKEKTLVRRVQRRMQVLQIESFPAYVEFIRREREEGEALFRELLIGVTEFFRDPEAFEALRANVLPALVAKKTSEPLRIWVSGCATGEEVYSIAILLKEVMGQHSDHPGAIIFGTDLDANAVAFARAGRYRKLNGLSPERVDRWFAKDGDDYCPIPAIRDMCVFSVHNLVKDPPFSKLDLVSCRNVLIYLGTEFQNRVIQVFHYALNSGGYLFLGPSESAGRDGKLFSVLDKKYRILQRRDGRQPMSPVFYAGAGKVEGENPAPARPVPNEDLVARGASRLMEKYAPAYVVIDRNHDIVRFSGGEFSSYLEPSAGAASLNLFNILRRDLRSDVRTSLQEALTAQTPVVNNNLSIRVGSERRAVVLMVEPLSGSGAEPGLCVVAFRERNRPAELADTQGGEAAPPESSEALQRELRTLRAQLQTARDEMETYIEENKSATEEYQSVNEELQSSNEELETAKEEMQSVNEELQTINSELNSKHETLQQTNSDLQNLFDSTQIATIFLDDELCVRNFTPATTDLFPLRQSDRGRRITDFVSNLKYDELRQDVQDVQRKLSVIEREVTLKDGAETYILRMRPYRSVKNVINGVVITFSNITARKKSEVTLRESEERYRALFGSIDEGFCVIDVLFDGKGKPVDYRFLEVNPAFEKQSGLRDAVGKGMRELAPDHEESWFEIYGKVAVTGEPIRFENEARALEGRWFDVYAFRLGGPDSRKVAIIFTDMTERRRASEHAGMLRAIVESSGDAIISKDLDGRITSWNRGAEGLFGYTAEEAIGEPITILIPPDRLSEETDIIGRVRRGEVIDHFETVRRRKDGSLIDISLTVSPIRNSEGKIVGASKIARDITERKQHTEHLAFLMREMSHRTNNLLAVIQAMAQQTARHTANYADFAARFNSRLQGLSYSNELLVKQKWTGAAVDDLVRAQLRPFVEAEGNDLETDGPAVALNVEAVQSLGLALHELATNASKHGALSKAGGKVIVRWEFYNGKTEPCFRLIWSEQGGPPVKPSDRKGFGSIVLEKMTQKNLDAVTKTDLLAGGLKWTLDCPAKRVLEKGWGG